MKAGNIIMVLLLIVVVSMLVIPSSPMCILPKKQQQVGCMSDDDCSGNQYCDQSDNMCKLSNQLTEDEELLNERRAANNAVAEAAASEDIERYTEHLDASLNYCTNDLLSAAGRYDSDDMADFLLDGYNQDSSDNDILHVTLMKTETEMLNIIAQLIRKISKIYNNNKNYNGVSKRFTRSYNNLIDVFSTFTKINSSEVQDIGITCNIQNYVNRSSFAGPIFSILFDDIGDISSQDPQICFESEQDSIDMGKSYIELIKMVFYSIGLVHKILQVYQLENLVYDPNGLKIKTNILNEMSMKAPIAMGTYAFVSGVDNGEILRKHPVIGQDPYEVGGEYIFRNRKIILTPETEPNLECDINPENIYSSDPLEENMYYLTGDDNIDNQLNNWNFKAAGAYRSNVIAAAVKEAGIAQPDEGNLRIEVGIDKMREYIQEREAAGEGSSMNVFSLEHVYKDGTPVINNEKAFVTPP